MGASVRALGLYDLLRPFFPVGILFPDYIDRYLSLLAVADLQSASDANAVLYTGTVFFPSAPGNPPVLKHEDTSGRVFTFDDLTLDFRLLIPRAGASQVKTVVDTLASADATFQPVKQVFDDLGAQTATPTDYPGIAFQLELLVGGLAFHLGDAWKPGKQGDDYRIVEDTAATDKDVRIELPKVLLRYTQSQDVTSEPSFSVAAWGNPGFDAPNDLSEGEVGTMIPPLAVHESGQYAFGIDELVVDFSAGSTPPEILDHFGTDASFEGVYAKALQFFYSSEDKKVALNVAVRDALVAFNGDMWLEAEADLMLTDGPFKAEITMYDGNTKVTVNQGTLAAGEFTGGSATVPPNVVIYVQVQGGVPPFTTSVQYTPEGGSAQELWDEPSRKAAFNPAPTASSKGSLVVKVTDSSATPQVFKNTLALTVAAPGAPVAAAPPPTKQALAHYDADARPAGIPDEYQVVHRPAASGTSEVLQILGGPSLPNVKVNGAPYTLGSDRQVLLDVQPGATATSIEVDWPGTSLPGTFRLLFDYGLPDSVAAESTYVQGASSDKVFNRNRVPDGVPGGDAHSGADALTYWVANALDLTKPIQVTASASNEGHDDEVSFNKKLSERRGDVASQLIATVAGAPAATVNAIGQTSDSSGNPDDRVAVITGTGKLSGAFTLTGKIARDANPAPQQKPAKKDPPKAPNPPTNDPPGFLRRLGFRARLEKSLPSMLEVSGEVDFETATESKLRDVSNKQGSLDMKPTPAATTNPNPQDGVVDFILNVTYDKASHELTETLTIGAAPADKDGLLHTSNPEPYGELKNIFGAVMLLTPIINAATEAIAPQAAGDWKEIAVDLGVPVIIGGLGIINTTDITLYGGELKLRENMPDGLSSVTFSDAALTFDYEVAFRIDIDALDIHSSRSMKVRYKAVGIKLNFQKPYKFEFVLDTSKGYTLDLSDPSIFKLPDPLGDILKIAAARLARFNPLTLELDLEIKADLGIVTVDKFLVKVPLDGTSSPMIVPSGVKINIPETLVGSGSVKIDPGGFEGTIDVTLVPCKLRIAASVGVEQIPAPPRAATAFYLGLEVDFPSPIMLGSTSLGLYGLFGLFGMHYAMKESAPIPGDAVGPDLRWLIASGGAPYKLENNGVTLWEPKLDNWAFGVGVVLGTVDGFLLSLRGALILTLPGPRIIVTCNLQIVTELSPPSSDGMDATSLDVGIIGILDIDIGAGQVTLGVMVNLEVKDLVQVQIPIQIYFSWVHPEDWHLWIGTIQTPASAKVLGIVRGGGYFMAQGQALTPFPPGSNLSLPATAVALGVSASIVWGSESIKIYLKVAASANFGVSFTPDLFIVGNVHLEGELRLVVISIGAYGDFLLKAPNPTFFKVHVCGSVDCFFFSIDACVDWQIGNDSAPLPPLPLINRMYLQSFAPVIASGQGGDRPIDGSLGDGVLVTASGLPGMHPVTGTEVSVPIDSVPVLQLQYGVDTSTLTQTFTSAVPACVTYPGTPGVSLGGGRSAQYKLKTLAIDPPLPGGVTPPVAWRPNKPSTNTSETQVDLALFSRNPNVTNSALERSTELTNQQSSIWGDLCETIAPPASVFWAFCGQRLGPSHAGWTLQGIPTPDPPNTVRTAPVPTSMDVEQPALSAADALLVEMGQQLGAGGLFPAQVIGQGVSSAVIAGAVGNLRCMRAIELPEQLAVPITTGFVHELNDSTAAGVIATTKSLVSDNRWLRFHTGQSTKTRVLLALDSRVAKLALTPQDERWVLIRERGKTGTLVKETPLRLFNPAIVSSAANLPADWTVAGGPFTADVASIFVFLHAIHLVILYFEFVPQDETLTLEVAYTGDIAPRPSVVVGALETLPLLEQTRAQNASIVQTSTIQQIESYLDGGTPVPLLEPGTEYTITATYDVTVTEKDGSTNDVNGIKQGFRFKTTSDPPARLDPWVLATSPDQNEQHVFYDDPGCRVNVLFNDSSIIQLFTKLGFSIAMDLRAADGFAEPMGTPVTTTSVSGVGTAAYDSLLQLVQSGQLPCVGGTSSYQNQLFTAPFPLRPLMGYTLDLRTDPPLPQPNDHATPVTPLFRRTFSTSKYPSLKSLADDLFATRITHRPLKQKLAFAPSGTQVTPDQDLLDAFAAAGEQALPPPKSNAIVMYWVPSSPGGPFVPHAILVDATEPLWRTRPEPAFTNPIPSDPTFRIVTIAPQPTVEIREVGGPSIAGYVASPGGTRTVAMFVPGFTPPAGGTVVQLALHRPASPCYGNAEETNVFLTVPVAPLAPWEDDHV